MTIRFGLCGSISQGYTPRMVEVPRPPLCFFLNFFFTLVYHFLVAIVYPSIHCHKPFVSILFLLYLTYVYNKSMSFDYTLQVPFVFS